VRGKRRVMVVVSLGEEFSSVPEVFGESLRGARLLIERAGLSVGGVTRVPSEDVGDELVTATDPPAESVLPRNTAVALLVSTGQGVEQFVMPDLLGREIGSVRRQLEALGFRVLVPPAGASVGTIVYQDPAAGARITRDATVMLQATGRMIR
jgi:serine/threonine-protein kinase